MILAVINHPVEGLGTMRELLHDEVREVLGEELTGREEFDSLIVMGGPMGVYEMDKFPFLRKEIDLIRRTDKVLGICLGSQLISFSLGGKVSPGHFGEERGVLRIRTLSPLREVLGETPYVFQWHGDTFTLPDGAQLLGYNERYFQAFSHGRKLALQFHLEVDGTLVRRWVDTYGGSETLVKEVKEREEELREQMSKVLRWWLSL